MADQDLSQLTHVEAEKTVLGSILMDNQSIYQCGDIQVEDFFLTSHRQLFAGMKLLVEQNLPVDVITLSNHLQNTGQLKVIGDVTYIASLIDGVVGGSIHHVVKIVKDLALRRRHVQLCNAAISQAFDLSDTTENCIAVTSDRIMTLAGKSQHNRSYRMSEYSEGVYADIERLSEVDPTKNIGLPTGIKRLDDFTTGIRPGELWILGSWTGSGKTALLAQMVAACAGVGRPALWFTQEMSRRAVLLRLIPALTNGTITARKVRRPYDMSRSELELFRQTKSVIDKWPLYVNDATSLDITHLVAHARMMIQQHHVELVAVDYLQLLRAEAPNRYERVTKISEALRELSKKTNVPVVVVSQLSRPEDKKIRPPRPFDLKESGNVENDAHVIILPYRPQDKEGHFTKEDVIIIGKQREGPTGSVPVEFSTSTLTFDPRDDGRTNEQEGMF